LKTNGVDLPAKVFQPSAAARAARAEGVRIGPARTTLLAKRRA
jgi:hypothetical protein